MKRRIWIAALSVSFLGACNWVSGECWLRSEDGAGSGQGGGPIVPAGGGFGDDPAPTPQDVSPPPPPECLQVPQGACYQNCLKVYEDNSGKCGNITDASQRNVCQMAAYTAYKTCTTACAKDPEEQCKKLCDKINDDCIAACPKGDKGCMNKCNQQNGKCLKDCEK